MGMFDELQSKYPLPGVKADTLFQTKSLDCRMDLYEIREDGTLWREEYDVVDRSNPYSQGWERIFGCMSRQNKRWVKSGITGEVYFYHYSARFSVYFVGGAMKTLVNLSGDEPVIVFGA